MAAKTRTRRLRRMSPVDAAWFRMSTVRSPADIVALFWLDGQVDEAELRNLLTERLLSRRRFRQHVVESPLGILPPHWEEDPHATVDGHVFRRTVAAAGGDAELTSLVTELMNDPMDPHRSPWRVWLIEGCPGGSIILTQLQHCLGDGFALLQILLTLADGATGARARAQVSPAAGPSRSARATLGRLARRLPRELQDLGHLARLPFDPLTRLRGALSGERRVAWSQNLALARIKALARAHRATINDVLLTVLAGALRQYFENHAEPLRPLRAVVPVNLRPPGDPIDETHANWFGLVYVDLPIDEPDRTARLTRLKHTVDRIKDSDEPAVSLGLLNLLGLVPAAIGHAAMDLFARKGTVVVSNLPGPREAFGYAGRPVRDMLFWVPHPSGLACGVSILSYAGGVRVGVRGDASVVPDPAQLAAFFERELLEWESVVDAGMTHPTLNECATVKR